MGAPPQMPPKGEPKTRRYIMIKWPFLATMALTFAGGAFASDQTALNVEQFGNQCDMLEKLDHQALQDILRLQSYGYFASFCQLGAFQDCGSFDPAVKPYGQLKASGQSCQFISSQQKTILVSH